MNYKQYLYELAKRLYDLQQWSNKQFEAMGVANGPEMLPAGSVHYNISLYSGGSTKAKKQLDDLYAALEAGEGQSGTLHWKTLDKDGIEITIFVTWPDSPKVELPQEEHIEAAPF